MIRTQGFAFQKGRVWTKGPRLAAACFLLFGTFGLCAALAQTPTTTPTTTVTGTLTPTTTQTLAATATSTPPAPPTMTVTPFLTSTPNASASPTATKTVTRTPTVTITRAGTKTHTPGPGQATPTQTPAGGGEVLVGFIPVVGSLPGNFGSFFRTSVQLLNPGTSTSSGRLVFHPAGVPGSPGDPSLDFQLNPGQVVSYPDLAGSFNQSGLGSVDVYVDQGQTIPVVVSRIFNDAGANGTSGFTESFVRLTDIPTQGSGFLLGPSDVSAFRYNVGIRTIGGPVTLTITVRDSAGNVLHSVTRQYGADVFVQTSATDFLGFSLGNDQSIQIDFTGGGLIAYGATVDNVTNDPSAQIMSYVTPATSSAERSETPRGGSSAPIQLALLVAALGVGAGLVIAKR
ncbi:MAG TPA: hypothetical protein VGK26_10180 [Thermoanaerobaculia bacterium]|jgi:hypothetical protein